MIPYIHLGAVSKPEKLSVPAVASAESVNLGRVVLPLIIVGALLFAMRNW